MQQVGVSEVSVAVDSQLGVKLASTDRGQASKLTVGSLSLSAIVVLLASSDGSC